MLTFSLITNESIKTGFHTITNNLLAHIQCTFNNINVLTEWNNNNPINVRLNNSTKHIYLVNVWPNVYIFTNNTLSALVQNIHSKKVFDKRKLYQWIFCSNIFKGPGCVWMTT